MLSVIVQMDNEQFETLASFPTIWQSAARRFILAANALYERYEDDWYDSKGNPLHHPDDAYEIRVDIKQVLLLYAYGVENLVKGTLIAKGILPAVKDRKLNRQLAQHKLRQLFRLVKVATSQAEDEILETLEIIITSGKYPIGKSAADSGPYGYTIPDIVLGVGDLLERLEVELRSAYPSAKPPIELLLLGRKNKRLPSIRSGP